MKAALESFHLLKSDSKALILGYMFELGANSIQEHQTIVNLTEDLDFSNVFFIGAHFHQTKTQQRQFETFEELKNYFIKNV